MKKYKIVNSIVVIIVLFINMPSIGQDLNFLTEEEKDAGWELLFNGENFEGWRQCNGESIPDNWEIENNAMKVFTGTGKKEGQGAGGDILYAPEKFKNFELSIDWKSSPKGNSGIFYYVQEVKGKPIYFAAPEVQVLDNENATDNKVDTHLAGSLYDMLAADPTTVNPAGEWNTVVINVNKGNVVHIMNGTEVVSYTLWTPEWDEMVMNSKFKNFKGFRDGIAKKGYIGLQDHGYTIWFRNIKIRKL